MSPLLIILIITTVDLYISFYPVLSPPALNTLSSFSSSAVSFCICQTTEQGHQKYIGNHYAACLALFYKLTNYCLCHSLFPPEAPPPPLCVCLPLSSALHWSQLGKSKLSECLLFLFPEWFPVEQPDCMSASKDANLFLTSGVKIIKEFLRRVQVCVTACT